jgi:ankyrin repeat protein
MPTRTIVVAVALVLRSLEPSQGLNDQLLTAVENGQLEDVSRLLKQGANANAADQYQLTALTWAAMKSQPAIARVLLAAGANPNPQPSTVAPAGFPLARAAGVGSLELVEILLDAGAQVNAKDKDGRTAIFKAAYYSSNLNILAKLINAGADIHAVGNNGMTCLIEAAGAGRAENVRLLLNKGAKVNARSNLNETALIHAAAGGHLEVVRLLLSAGADPSIRMSDGRTAVDIAHERGHTAVVNILQAAHQNL